MSKYRIKVEASNDTGLSIINMKLTVRKRLRKGWQKLLDLTITQIYNKEKRLEGTIVLPVWLGTHKPT